MQNTSQKPAIDEISTEGLESFFEASGHSLETSEDEMVTTSGQLIVSVAEASRILKIPYSSFRRMVKSGKYETISDESGHQKVVLQNDFGDQEKPHGHQKENGDHTSINGHTELLSLIGKLSDQLQEANSQLQSANYRIGTLESLVTERADQIKLLEDKQKVPWWRKSWMWFVGRTS